MKLNSNIIATISYLTLIGWVAAAILNMEKRDPLVTFHLKQSLGLFVLSSGLNLLSAIFSVVPFIGSLSGLLYTVIGFATILFWLLGMFSAFTRSTTPFPFFGLQTQKALKNLTV